MAAPAPTPPPIPLAGLTPPGGPLDTLDNSPNQPLTLTSDQLSKIGVTDVQPGDNVLVTARVTVGGTPDAPSATITALGDVKPDDGSANLISLSDDAPDPAGSNGLPITPGSDDSAGASLEPDLSGDSPAVPPPSQSDAEEKMLGYKRPQPKNKKPISAKEAFGE